MNMNKMEGFMIRIEADKHATLKQISEATSTKMVDIGRHALDALIEHANLVGMDSLAFPLRYPNEIAKLKKRNQELEALITKISQIHTEPDQS